MNQRLKVPVHVEIHLLPHCSASHDEIHALVKPFLSEIQLFSNSQLPIPPSLQNIVSSIQVCDLPLDQSVSFWQADIVPHFVRLSEQGPDCDYLEGDEDIPAAEQWELPNIYLKGLWDSIIVDHAIKQQLINYCCSSISFADAGIDANIISWNKMILLHGPPGTGKTSLCKALAQKVFIRNSHRFQSGLLFEINAHSLFSKWFSESGKLVMKLFNHISDIAEDSRTLVILLIDEVESIANARSSASQAGEPGDAVRVVNAVLTSLDSLRRKNNVLVLCTSNMLASLDEVSVVPLYVIDGLL
ncbi:AAA family ATPase [archaeon]|nr:MAG: AAA family ATPase [archaeon]